MATMDRPPWQDWPTPELYAELFPGGDADLQAFYDRVEEQERTYGIPSVREDFGTYYAAAKIAARPAGQRL